MIEKPLSSEMVAARRDKFYRYVKHRRKALVSILLAKCSARCGWCGESLRRSDTGNSRISIDHIVPICLGGDPVARKNLRLVHHVCNMERGNSERLKRGRNN